MTKIEYGMIREVYTLNAETRISYGIAAYYDPQTNGTAIIIASVRDITNNAERLHALVQLCNQHQLSPKHLADTVEDYFSQ